MGTIAIYMALFLTHVVTLAVGVILGAGIATQVHINEEGKSNER